MPEAGSATPNSMTIIAISVPSCRSRSRAQKGRRHAPGLAIEAQHRVVEDFRELEAGGQDHDQDQDRVDRQATLRSGHREPEQHAAHRHDERDGGEPWFSRAGAIGHRRRSAARAARRRCRRWCSRELQASCPRTGVADDDAREVGREHEDVDQADVGRARELEQRPGELAAQIRRLLAGRRKRCAVRGRCGCCDGGCHAMVSGGFAGEYRLRARYSPAGGRFRS